VQREKERERERERESGWGGEGEGGKESPVFSKHTTSTPSLPFTSNPVFLLFFDEQALTKITGWQHGCFRWRTERGQGMETPGREGERGLFAEAKHRVGTVAAHGMI